MAHYCDRYRHRFPSAEVLKRHIEDCSKMIRQESDEVQEYLQKERIPYIIYAT